MDDLEWQVLRRFCEAGKRGEKVVHPDVLKVYGMVEKLEHEIEILRERENTVIQQFYELMRRHQQELHDLADAENSILTRGRGT